MKLNENTREHYKVFDGRFIDIFEELRNDNRVPLSIREIAEKRLTSKRNDWREYYFDSSTAFVFFKDEIKVIPHCELLVNLKKTKKLLNGEYILSKATYQKLPGKVFKRKSVILNIDLTQKEALNHPIWKYLLGELLPKYVALAFQIREKNMGLFLPLDKYSILLRSTCFYRLECRSQLWCCGCRLGSGSGRLVGEASEMREVLG